MLRYVSKLDDSHFSAALRRMETGAVAAGSKISRAFSSVGGGAGGALGLGAIALAANAATNRLSDLADRAASVGVGVEQLQRFEGALSMTGVSAGEAQRALSNLTRSIVEGRDAGSAAGKAFEKLGVDIRSFDPSEPIDALAKLGDGFKASEDRAGAFAALSELVGAKVAARLVPSLAEGGAKFRELAGSIDVATQALVEWGDRMGDKRDKAISNFSNYVQNKLFIAGQLAADAFEKGYNDAGGGFMGKVRGTLNAAAALKVSYSDPDRAERMAGRNLAFDPEQLAREKPPELGKRFPLTPNDEERAKMNAGMDAFTKAARKADDDMLKSHDQRIDRQLDNDREYIDRFSNQVERGEKFWTSIRKSEAEKRKGVLEKEIEDMQSLQNRAQAELGNAQQDLHDFNRADPDSRRQMVRDAWDEHQAEQREKRMRENPNAKDARHGAGDRLGRADEAQKIADAVSKAMADKQKELADLIVDGVEKLVTK